MHDFMQKSTAKDREFGTVPYLLELQILQDLVF